MHRSRFSCTLSVNTNNDRHYHFSKKAAAFFKLMFDPCGVPTREPLLGSIARSGRSGPLLEVVSFADPNLEMVARLKRKKLSRRPIVQVAAIFAGLNAAYVGSNIHAVVCVRPVVVDVMAADRCTCLVSAAFARNLPQA